MGIIVLDSLTLDTGITVDSYYAAIAMEKIYTFRVGDKYETLCTIQFWVSKSARDEGTSPFYAKEYLVSSNVAPTASPYETIYAEFKTGLTNYTDDL